LPKLAPPSNGGNSRCPGKQPGAVASQSSAFLDSPDVYPGGAESNGNLGSSRDLVFRSWVTPAN
jgi:hypothetical protein